MCQPPVKRSAVAESFRNTVLKDCPFSACTSRKEFVLTTKGFRSYDIFIADAVE
jgi:hypothetical protein